MRVKPKSKEVLIAFNKPFQVLCQFSESEGKRTLAEFIQVPDVYPAGRLDFDSEGLLLLTNQGRLQAKITDPEHKMPKTYWVQVEGCPTEMALECFRKGLDLKDGRTRPAQVKIIPEPNIWERVPPVRYRASIPTTWLEVVIREGKNRQVRRMTAAIGYPTLRLIRVAIGPWSLDKLRPGDFIYHPIL